MRTHYDILGITNSAPPEIIAAVYRAWMRAMKIHPDLGGDEELARLINQAYDVLKDPKRRAAYDAWLVRQPGGAFNEKGRRALRTAVDAPVAYCPAPGSDWHPARAVDASLLGLKIRTDRDLVIGMHLSIAFPGSATPAVEAVVRWSKSVGDMSEAGVEFFEPLPDIIRRLGVKN